MASSVFDIERSEQFLCQLHDTGVPGGTLSLIMHGKTLFLEMKSPHSMFSMINNRLADLKTLRKAVKKAIKLHEEYVKKGQEEVALTRTQTDIRVAERKQTQAADGRGNKTSKTGKGSKGEKSKTGKKQTKKN